MTTELAIQFAKRLEGAADYAEAMKFSVANLSTIKIEECRALAAFIRGEIQGGFEPIALARFALDRIEAQDGR